MESEIILIILNEKEINYIIIKSQGNKIGFTEDYDERSSFYTI